MGKEERGARMALVDNFAGWVLCRDAEARLKRSMAEGKVVLVNGLILAGAEVRSAGVALQSYKARNGIVNGSRWYEPADSKAYNEIKEAVNDPNRYTLDLPGIAWVDMRELRDAVDTDGELIAVRHELFREVRKVASEIANGPRF